MIDWTQMKTAEQKAQEAETLRLENVDSNRKAAYIAETDPLFFKAQRGEATMQEWLDKVSEIKTRFPKNE